MNAMEMTTGAASVDATKRRRARALTVAATVAGALGLWAVYHLVLGIDLRTPAFGEDGGTDSVGPGNVVLISALAAFAAWGLLALLERLTPRARSTWLVIAVLALLASLGGPMSGTGINTENRMELLGFHLLVGAVLIPLLYRTSRSRGGSSRRRRDEQLELERPRSKEAA